MLRELEGRLLCALSAEGWKTQLELIKEQVGSPIMMASNLSALEENGFIVSRIKAADSAEIRSFRELNGADPLPQREYQLNDFGLRRREELRCA